MFPVISLGPFNISSLGVFLAAGFLFGVFLIWRLSRAWDLVEEKVLDLTLLTFFGGLIGARLYFILENFPLFGTDLSKWIFFHKYQGFSFWGAFLGGYITLYFFSKKFKINFWQALDIASVGFLGGLIFGALGCFLGGCSIGIPSNLFFALTFVGVVAKRIPVQIIEASLLTLTLIRIWKFATHFHITGSVAAVSLIAIGAIKFTLEPLRDIHEGRALNVILILMGIIIFYKVTKRKILSDIKAFGLFLISLIKDPQLRKKLMMRLGKNWYNYKVNIKWKIRLLVKILRRLNVRFSHKDSKYY